MGDLVLGILSLSLIGLVLVGVLVVLWIRSTRRRLGTAAGTRCHECGGDLRGWESSYTCPHCYASLGEDADDDDAASIDEEFDEVDEDESPFT